MGRLAAKRARVCGGVQEIGAEKLKRVKEEVADAGSDSEVCNGAAMPDLCGYGVFFYFEQGQWCRFGRDSSELLARCVADELKVAEFWVLGSLYFVNLALMIQMNAMTGYRRSIAWINDKGRFCSPRFPFECAWEGFPAKLPLTLSDFKGLQLPLRGIFPSGGGAVGDCEERSVLVSTTGADTEVSSAGADNEEINSGANKVSTHWFSLIDSKVDVLDSSSREFEVIAKKFCDGLGYFTDVKTIYRHKYATLSAKARKLAFENHIELMKENHKDPNIQLAWHGICKQEIPGLILHGFGHPKNGLTYGYGAYLSPENKALQSVMDADIDETGEQHLVLCRVILGSVELVPEGSTQFHPSSDTFDTGVDDIAHPSRYIVWATHMNTHILPLYVISFKLPLGKLQKLRSLPFDHPSLVQKPPFKANIRHGKVPKSPWMSFSVLFAILSKRMPSSDLFLLQQDYGEFKAGKISREDMVKKVRNMAGDKLLHEAMNMMTSSEAELTPAIGKGTMRLMDSNGHGDSLGEHCLAFA